MGVELDLAQGEAERPKAKLNLEPDEVAGAADSLQLFLADVGKHKLLTAAEEVTLAKRIERVTRPLGAPDDRVEPPAWSSSRSRRATAVSASRSWTSSRRARWASTAQSRSSTGGAATSSPRTPRGGFASPCSARWRTTRGRSAPVHVVERQQKLGRAARRLEVELGREATKEELAEATGLPLQHIDEALGAATRRSR